MVPEYKGGIDLLTSVIDVKNIGGIDLVIAVVQVDRPRYIGRVEGFTREIFPIPSSALAMGSTYRLLLEDRRTGERFVTGPIPTQAGQRVRVDIGRILPVSQVFVSGPA